MLCFFGNYFSIKNLKNWFLFFQRYWLKKSCNLIRRDYNLVNCLKVCATKIVFQKKIFKSAHSIPKPTKFTPGSLGMSGCDWTHFTRTSGSTSFTGYYLSPKNLRHCLLPEILVIIEPCNLIEWKHKIKCITLLKKMLKFTSKVISISFWIFS